MKLKYYLRGIGIGLIVTTLIMMIALAIHKEQPMSDDEIRERAAELGMIMPENLPARDTLSNNDTVSPESSDADASVGADENSPESEGIEAEESESSKSHIGNESSSDGSETKDDKTKPEVIEQAEISIVGGEYSDDVCKKLKKAGVIEDADDFNKYLAEGGYDNLIQPGNYVIPLDADYDTIIKLITEKKR